MQQVPIRCCNAHTRGRHHARQLHQGWRMAALQEHPWYVWPAPVELLRGLPRAQFGPWPKSRCSRRRFHIPCCASAPHDGHRLTVLNLTVIQLRHLDETVATLGCAPIVCRAHGTFWNSYVNTFHTKKLVGDGLLTNFTKAWKNTAQQRDAILYHRRR